jgi:copper(I)-binding protein
MANIAAVLRDLPFAKRSRVEVAFVTVDPARDSPERLREWLAKFDPGFVALREKVPGDMAAVNRALMLPAAVTYPAESGYTVGHPAQVIAFDADGLARYVYPFGTRQEDWAHDLPILLGAAGAAPGQSDTAPATVVKPRNEALRVEQVFIPEPPASTAALYATIVNQGGDDVLLGIHTPRASHTALHEQVRTKEGNMAMRHLAKIAVPGGQTTRLAPGGLHGMLMGVDEFAKGSTVPVVFEFQEAGRIAATAKVVGYEEVERLQAEGK